EELERQVSELSYGAQRQLEVGLALIARPKVLLLDEPTSGMSPEETGRMLRLVDDLPRDLAVLLIEHDMDLVFTHADRITVLNYGQVLMEGTPQEVRGSDVVQEIYLGGVED
ncbi:MAG: ATP-binding cassette domain-containing protein, partial [Limibacillus sp.]